MTLKNAHIIHFVRGSGSATRYVCIQACGTTPCKSTRKWSEVTCKNCLKILRTRMHYVKDYGHRNHPLCKTIVRPIDVTGIWGLVDCPECLKRRKK